MRISSFNPPRTGIAPLNGATRHAIFVIVGQHHVGVDNLTICRDLVHRIREGHAGKPEVSMPERGLIHSAVRYAVETHAANRETYRLAS